MKVDKVTRLHDHWLIVFTDSTAQVVRHTVMRNTDDPLAEHERLIGALCARLSEPQGAEHGG